MDGPEPSRFEAIFNSAVSHAIIAMDRDGRITEWNEGAHRILGWTAEEARGQDIDLLFTAEDRAQAYSRLEMAQAMLAGKGPDERWHVRKGGERFWATGEMMPLYVRDGQVEGFVKILRDRTRERLDEERLRERERALLRHDERLQMALNASGAVGLWDWSVETDRLHGDANFARLYGLDPERTAAGLTLQEYQENVVPEDLEPLRAQIAEVFAQGDDYLREYRVQVPGEPLRWLEVKGRVTKDKDGRPLRFSGTAVDITARKAAEQLKHLLMEELSHRVKNMFAMVLAIVFQTLRGMDGPLTENLVGRLTALSRAHDILMQTSWSSADLSTLIAQVLRLDAEPGRFDLDGPPLQIGARAALSLSLLLHELATNAIKYGALSVPGGIVRLHWRIDQEKFHLDWTEEGGPPAYPPTHKGFGSRLIELGLAGARRAELTYGEKGLHAEFCTEVAMMADGGGGF